MVDIQSATADIRPGIKKIERKKKIEITGQNIMPASATQGGHKHANCIRTGMVSRASISHLRTPE